MILHYDGSLPGLLTVLHRTLTEATVPEAIARPPFPDVGLFDQVESITTDTRIAAALWRRIGLEISPRAAEKVRLAYLSEHRGIELFLWRYLALGWKVAAQLDSCLAQTDVHTVHCWAQRTARESHRLKGLARFRETVDGMLYAPLRADANVLPLLAPHFASRLDRPWVIHDVGRRFGALGEKGSYRFGSLTVDSEIDWSADEAACQALWRSFYRQIAIPERVNRQRQRQFMPVKYWEFLVEMQPATSGEGCLLASAPSPNSSGRSVFDQRFN